MAKYGHTSENGGVVVIKKLLGTKEEDKGYGHGPKPEAFFFSLRQVFVSCSKVTDIKTSVFLSVLRFVAVIVESYKESLETLAL